MIIAVDFDGTIVDHRFPSIGKPVPGAFPWMKKFQKAGAKLILWTMRSDKHNTISKVTRPVLTEAVEFCRKRGVEFWAVNENPEQLWTKSPKVYAHIYIDDAAYGCPLRHASNHSRPTVNWAIVGPAVLKLVKEHFSLSGLRVCERR